MSVAPGLPRTTMARRAWRAAVWVLVGVAACSVGCRREPHQGASLRMGKAQRRLEAEPLVRVALERGVDRALLGCAGVCDVWVGPPSRRLLRGSRVSLEVALCSTGLVVNGRRTAAKWLALRPLVTAAQVGNRTYPGEVYAVREGAGLVVVNGVPVERYLCGVLGKEMKPAWPQEALKAQAVAARSYVLFRVRWSRRAAYHVSATSADQRYVGGPLDPRVRRAAAATRGMALVHEGLVIPAYYHSTCGGHTASAADVFGQRALAFIRGVACGYCGASPHSQWQTDLTSAEICRALNAHGSPVEAVTALQALDRREDGRPDTVRVFTGKGRKDLPAHTFRSALGSYRLKSTRFEIDEAAGGFRLTGQGFGHGVGMCQYGARGMALNGARCEQILAHYYPETALARLYE